MECYVHSKCLLLRNMKYGSTRAASNSDYNRNNTYNEGYVVEWSTTKLKGMACRRPPKTQFADSKKLFRLHFRNLKNFNFIFNSQLSILQLIQSHNRSRNSSLSRSLARLDSRCAAVLHSIPQSSSTTDDNFLKRYILFSYFTSISWLLGEDAEEEEVDVVVVEDPVDLKQRTNSKCHMIPGQYIQ
jgi:hypothetical protein